MTAPTAAKATTTRTPTIRQRFLDVRTSFVPSAAEHVNDQNA
jgi:hypothetical protein